ncbi:calcium-binding protein [Gemmobacter denitrificans]|uniref:Calcium-binding protein n=1 Tax=Gemmobacter denitrificans TaxID=3123040 RepID=A0ABU8C1E3_9RHOB
MTQTLSIDASALSGINLQTHIATALSGFAAASMTFWGGDPDSAFGGTYYMNGDQVLARYSEAGDGGNVQTDSVALIGGEDLAYDFIHNGASFGHGISGSIDSLTFGTWTDATTGTQGTGDEGLIAGLDEGLVIEGFGLSAAPGAGSDVAVNKVHALYTALRTMDAAAIYDLISGYAIEFTGSAGADTVRGYAADDVLLGGAGADRLHGMAGDDLLLGGHGADILRGYKGADDLRGGAGADTLVGGGGADVLTGGSGADVFVFSTARGTDTVTDFDVTQDLLDLTALGADGLADLTVTETETGVDLVLGQITIALNGVAAADLTDDLFLF